MNVRHIDLRQLMRVQFDAAKFWWGLASTCRMLVVVGGALGTLANTYTETLAFVAVALAVIATISQWYSDNLKGVANSLLRKIERHDGLGWRITGKELSDLMATIPESRKNSAAQSIPSQYFSSQAPESPTRLMENLEESSWMTKHQARRMALYVLVFSVVVVALVIVALIVAVNSTLSQGTSSNIARVALSVVALMFSGGYFRLVFDYHRYSEAADRIEEKASRLAIDPKITELEAVKLLHEYDIVRAGAPLLPSWLWKLMESELNQLWLQHRRQSPLP